MKIKLLIGILFLMSAGATFATPTNGLPFINDNYTKALTEAKQGKLPVFVECWAPW